MRNLILASIAVLLVTIALVSGCAKKQSSSSELPLPDENKITLK